MNNFKKAVYFMNIILGYIYTIYAFISDRTTRFKTQTLV